MAAEIQPVRIFIAYAHEDDASRERLRRQLSVLERRGHFHIFWDGLIKPGERWDERLKTELHRADIFLLLVSEYFLDSDYVHEVELPKALALRNEGKAEVLPVILRHCLWQYTELTDFQCILCEGRPVEDANGYAQVATIVAETAKQINDKRAGEARRQEEDAERQKAEKIAEAEARKQARVAATQKAAAEQTARERQLREQADHDAWEFAEDADTEASYRKYLSKYPKALHAAAAQAKLEVFEKKRADEERKQREAARKKEEAEAGRRAAQRAEEKAEAERKAKEAEEKRQREDTERKRREAEEAEKKNDPFHGLMVPIKGGAFDMGDTFGDGYANERPVHRVVVEDFQLCKYPVTQAQWKAIMGDNPSFFKGDDLPVENVSWNDAQTFIKKLNEKTGQKYRLPTEAEWEYAARGGNQSKGFAYAGSSDIDEVAWYAGNSGSKTHPVGKKKPNELGLCDMSGNVWEWCRDWYDDKYYGKSPEKNPAGPDSGSARVLRGGSWYGGADFCRVSSRLWNDPVDRDNRVGFRPARTVSF